MSSGEQQLPLVVQVGFAGSRVLVDPVQHPDVDQAEVDKVVSAEVEAQLRMLSGRLKLTHHFLCGISQIAIGADMAFSNACERLELPQRIFLPQPPDEFLAARGEHGADFSDQQQSDAGALLDAKHVIQVRVVSVALRREQRFEEVNLEIARVSDVMFGVLREDAGEQVGGTQHALQLARRRGIPVIRILVRIVRGKPETQVSWENEAGFKAPELPHGKWPMLPRASKHPEFVRYAEGLLTSASKVADSKQFFFSAAAFIVIATHLAATIGATAALALHGVHGSWLVLVLMSEIGLLAAGFAVHQYLHHTEASQEWALARSVAEIARSVMAARRVHAYLDHLFYLPYPRSLRHLLRTLSVLHSAASRPPSELPWPAKRDEYLRERVEHQLSYFRRMGRQAARHLRISHAIFMACTLLALLATSIKLYVISRAHTEAGGEGEAVTLVLGALAIALPVLAVGALSFAASLDREARMHTFGEMSKFLEDRAVDLKEARSELEFERLVMETERRLLGENASWFARRSFTAVS